MDQPLNPVSQLIAVIYARVSSVKQAEEELPIASQLEFGHQKAAELGAVVAKEFIDEAKTGRSDLRPSFQEAILYCELTSPAYLLVWSSARFARNKIDAALYKRRLQRAGTRLIYMSMDVDTSTLGGWMLDSMLEIFDEARSRETAADTLRSMIKNARDGHWNGGTPPFGYQSVPSPNNPKRRKLQPEPNEALLARRIFELRADASMGTRALVQWLKSNGFDRRGKPWNKTVLGYLLRNEALIGRSVFGRKDRSTGRQRPREEWVIVDSHEPIIPMDLWERTQKLLDAATLATRVESGSPLSRHAFTGLLSAPDGQRYQIESAKGRSKRYWYYTLKTAAGNRRIPAGELDEWLISIICSDIFDAGNLTQLYRDLEEVCSGWAKDRDERRRVVVRQMQDVERRRGNLFDLLEEYGRDAPNLGDLTRRLREHNSKLEALESQLAAIESEPEPRLPIGEGELSELGEVLREVVRDSDPKKQRAFFQSFIDVVIVHADRVELRYRPECLVKASGAVPSKDSWLPETAIPRTISLTRHLPQPWCRAA